MPRSVNKSKKGRKKVTPPRSRRSLNKSVEAVTTIPLPIPFDEEESENIALDESFRILILPNIETPLERLSEDEREKIIERYERSVQNVQDEDEGHLFPVLSPPYDINRFGTVVKINPIVNPYEPIPIVSYPGRKKVSPEIFYERPISVPSTMFTGFSPSNRSNRSYSLEDIIEEEPIYIEPEYIEPEKSYDQVAKEVGNYISSPRSRRRSSNRRVR